MLLPGGCGDQIHRIIQSLRKRAGRLEYYCNKGRILEREQSGGEEAD
jgi:hypothetical protein